MMVDSPHPLVAAERITLEFLHLETTSEPFPMLIDKYLSLSAIRDEVLELYLPTSFARFSSGHRFWLNLRAGRCCC